jgi:integrase
VARKPFTFSKKEMCGNGCPLNKRIELKMSDGDPHNRKTRIENTLKSIKNSGRITHSNKDFAIDFKKFLDSQNLSLDRTSRYLYSLKTVAEEVEWNLSQPDKDRLIELVGDINQSKYWDKDISHATKKEYKKLIRKMYSSYLDSKRKDLNGEELTDFFSVTSKKNYADPDELPRPNHVAEIVRNCPRPRDSGFCMLLWSSSARIGAILGLKWKDIRFHEDIATVKFRDTKTGDDRKVPVASAFPYLKHHKENDMISSNPEAFVFRHINSKDPEEQLSYNGAKGIIERAVERTEIPDHIKTNPHAFRKGRISDLARKGFSEAQISNVSGHVIGSEEIRIYCRLASEDVTSDIREEAGLEVEEDEVEQDPLRPNKCPNKSCNHLNKWENQHCTKCGEVLETGELFKEVKEKETREEIRKNIIDKQTDWDSETISSEAEEIVNSKL